MRISATKGGVRMLQPLPITCPALLPQEGYFLPLPPLPLFLRFCRRGGLLLALAALAALPALLLLNRALALGVLVVLQFLHRDELAPALAAPEFSVLSHRLLAPSCYPVFKLGDHPRPLLFTGSGLNTPSWAYFNLKFIYVKRMQFKIIIFVIEG
jgi:hypothetical protein